MKNEYIECRGYSCPQISNTSLVTDIQHRPIYVIVNYPKDIVVLYSSQANVDLEILESRVPKKGVLIINDITFYEYILDIQQLAERHKWSVYIIENTSVSNWFRHIRQMNLI